MWRNGGGAEAAALAPAAAFAPALDGREHAALRAAVLRLAAGTLFRPLRADTVFAAAASVDAAARADGPALHLLFDLHRVFLYDCPAGARAASVASVARHVLDDHPFQPLERLEAHLRRQPYRFLFDVEALSILSTLWADERPGVLVALDFVTGEVRLSRPIPHPRAEPTAVRRAFDARLAPPAPAIPSERWTDASLRQPKRIDVEGLTSPDVGIVREAHLGSVAHVLPNALARLAVRGGGSQTCGGKALRADDAERVAAFEAIERYHVLVRPADEVLVHGSADELRDRAVDPRALFFNSGESDRSVLPAFDVSAALHWTWAFDARSGEAKLVPAHDLWFDTGALPDERSFVTPTTSGCALGGSFEEAAIFAVLEAIERDAFLAAWYLRRTPARIDADSIDSEPFQLLRRRWEAAYPEHRLHLLDLTVDTAVPVVGAVAVRERGDGIQSFHAAAAHLDVRRAAHSALKDLAIIDPALPPEKRERYRAMMDEPRRVVSPEDHFGLYALPETFARQAFLFGSTDRTTADEIASRALIPPAERYDLGDVLRRIAIHLESLGCALLLKDVTHPAIAERGLRCVRAVTPGLLPMWFGHGRFRVRVTDRLRRLARDLAGQTIDGVDDLNLDPHPFP